MPSTTHAVIPGHRDSEGSGRGTRDDADGLRAERDVEMAGALPRRRGPGARWRGHVEDLAPGGVEVAVGGDEAELAGLLVSVRSMRRSLARTQEELVLLHQVATEGRLGVVGEGRSMARPNAVSFFSSYSRRRSGAAWPAADGLRFVRRGARSPPGSAGFPAGWTNRRRAAARTARRSVSAWFGAAWSQITTRVGGFPAGWTNRRRAAARTARRSFLHGVVLIDVVSPGVRWRQERRSRALCSS